MGEKKNIDLIVKTIKNGGYTNLDDKEYDLISKLLTKEKYYVFFQKLNEFRKIQNDELEIYAQKNHDYGNSFQVANIIGILIRLGDKINRMMTISEKKIELVNDESLMDTLQDMANYANMGIMLLQKEKK